MRRKQLHELIAFTILRLAAWTVVGAFIMIVYFLVQRGLGAVSWRFLTEWPSDSMTKGGIFPALLGTFYLTAGAIGIALPLGILSAIHLTEYARNERMLRLIRLSINNLASVPSVVFGLFGAAAFVVRLRFGVSLLAGCLTLALLVLPTIISAAEEALRNVPATLREASLALGATKWQTTYRIVLPSALPGIMTGTILGIGRAAGETAPIIFTAVAFFTPTLSHSIFSPVMALPYHIYVLATAGTRIEETRPLQYAAALVLVALVLGLNLIAVAVRSYYRRRLG
ncbi:MAG TPA: phosphate ABC transporter permease PstA [Blastocatellia bacterium]|nr:phosphate ABC transporter permease PstA [Blastocatellia bacterium]